MASQSEKKRTIKKDGTLKLFGFIIQPQNAVVVLYVHKTVVFRRTVHEQRLILCIGHDGSDHQTQFVNDTGTLESSVQNAAAFQEQSFDAKVRFQLAQGFSDVNLSVPGENMGNPHGLQISKVPGVRLCREHFDDLGFVVAGILVGIDENENLSAVAAVCAAGFGLRSL